MGAKNMKKLKDNWVFELSITTILLGLMCYAAYSLWYIFDGTLSSGDVHLYTALTSIALGWFMMIFTKTIIEKANWFMKLCSFLTGCVLFQVLIWGINANMNPVINDDTFNDDNVVIYVFTVVFIMSAILLLGTFIVKAIRKPRIVNIIFASGIPLPLESRKVTSKLAGESVVYDVAELQVTEDISLAFTRFRRRKRTL